VRFLVPRNDKIVVTKFEEVVWWDSSCLGMTRLGDYVL
jgi:hypothetical protein